MKQNQSTTMNNLDVSNEATSTKSNESVLKIYCDMDGVLTDFNKQFSEIHPWGPKKFTEKNGLDEFWQCDRSFSPEISTAERDHGYARWQRAINATISMAE